MRRVDLANRLIAAPNNIARRKLLAENARLADERLADEIRMVCYAAWTTEPVKAQRAAAAMRILSSVNPATAIRAATFWVAGISDITKGKFESAAATLDETAALLTGIDQINKAAQAQVARLLALAMLGRYDEAIRTGRMALKVFIRDGDDLAAGKIEMNLSNIVSRQGRHREAEKYAALARRRFVRAGEKGWQTMAENDLANSYSELNEFDKARRFYERALDGARSEKMRVTEAEIKASLGNLALVRGRYAEALRYLELSRQGYDELGMPHQSAIADLEIADIYAELNLFTEAYEIYAGVSEIFKRLKLRAEEARSRLNYGRTAARLGAAAVAKRELSTAVRLFSLESNRSGRALAILAQAEIAMGHADYDTALKILASAAAEMPRAGNPRHFTHLKLLMGETLLGLGHHRRAQKALSEAYTLAQQHSQENSSQIALNLMGKVSLATGETAKAKSYFSKAVKAIERLRSPITADEFSMAFLSSRLEPFQNLAKLYLEQGRLAEAFKAVERGRSRSLLDVPHIRAGNTRAVKKLDRRSTELRSELNFQYKKLDRLSGEEAARLRLDIHETEAKLAVVIRQVHSIAAPTTSRRTQGLFDLKALYGQLGKTRSLVEYIILGDQVSAFIVADGRVRFVSGLGSSAEIGALLEDLHFQFDALRYGGRALAKFTGQLKARADNCLGRLYDQLMRPLAQHLSGEALVIVPAGPLHYVPFHALYDGSRYVVEDQEISYAPSAALWSKLQGKRTRKPASSLLMAYADDRIPLVEREVGTIKKIAPGPMCFTGKRATFAAFTEHAPKHDVIHLACHGQFRPDNPMFSSLHLADGWVTVQDICAQRLTASLVTLSACETGLSKIFAGDEILGLARGFLSAGASSLVVSLWTVNDDATSRLMARFYSYLQRTPSVSASLRLAQLEFVQRGEHPFLWSPFVSIGA